MSSAVKYGELMNPNAYLQYFEKNYKEALSKNLKNLGTTIDRYTGFRILFELLLNKRSGPFVIVETGCQRKEDDWGAGQSSFLFFEFLTIFGGILVSIDNNKKHLSTCQRILNKCFSTSQATFLPLLGDSVKKLTTLNMDVDLLYLDSLDIAADNPQASMEHATKELMSARHIIAKSKDEGLLIGVDDNGPLVGKGKYIREWVLSSGKELLYDGYQIVFRL